MNEFYVGYVSKAPAGISRRIRAVVIALMAIAVMGAFTFASVQRTFAPAIFEYGKQRSFEGIIERKPFPTLLVKRPGSPDSGSSHYLLVAEGKHGADDEVFEFEGKSVRLKGTLIYRGSQTMIEVVKGSISVAGSAEALPAAAKTLGVFELDGEIVDGKCYLGVMNPGSGKVHRDCAARCLSGGVPILFATNNFRGEPGVLQLTDSDQKPLAKAAFLDHVGQPLRLKGTVVKNGDTLIFKIDPSGISELR
ncbi:MAG TPA: hypothetical protein VN749_21135 [Candidatus Eisenbacteria bacterium]|nr:hypothetical protein [Candidatus Eisenbacteria bacterium]